MIAFLQSHAYFVIPIIMLSFLVFRAYLRKRRTKKEFEEMSQYKQRDEALVEALRNPEVKEKIVTPEGPMEIMWDDKVVNKKGKMGRSLMIELVELSKYSRRRYIYRLNQPIQIGSGKNNQLELLRDGVAERHCEIFLKGKKPCARSLSDAKTLLMRGTASAIISSEGVYLNSGDRIQMGTAEIQIRIFRG